MFTKEIITSYLENNLIRVQKHAEKDLFIYNYTAETQYGKHWDEVTLQCRGLILDEEMNIIARPLPKFFNLGEIEKQNVPTGKFEVHEKMDGSLGILYWIDNKPFIATRGSFQSEQAEMATQMLHSTYQPSIAQLDRSKTYLFEIIYPENRIVVDYENMKALVLLAIVDKETGTEMPLQDIGFPVVKKYEGIAELKILQNWKDENKEGFVIKYENDFRLKIKLEEYVRLHRIITHVSSISIWAFLKEKDSLGELLERVPDEFYNWVKKEELNLKSAYETIKEKCKNDFKILATRKDTALYFMTCDYPAVLFKMLDKNEYKKTIWLYLKPRYVKPYWTRNVKGIQINK